ncbi:hypothetical protein KIN20_018293 [Parelaphostrongylus tenuis]|uniref:Uncharacterized protein n=1 Tax=Parelaphostrongylus tenuis TaxID=148309 RepID=A0AAD5QPE8_PARTN|nr:hypothetical protein KIN20_018293 [Parelaphostrongylus tenuis]
MDGSCAREKRIEAMLGPALPVKTGCSNIKPPETRGASVNMDETENKKSCEIFEEDYMLTVMITTALNVIIAQRR